MIKTNDRKPTVTAVVVTYSNRWIRFGASAARSAVCAGADRLIVVNNGGSCSQDIDSFAISDSKCAIEIIHLECNTGSAGGFAARIQKALEHQSDYLWLLDDDLVAEPETLNVLLDNVECIKNDTGLLDVAVVGSRDDTDFCSFVSAFTIDAGIFLGRNIFKYVKGLLSRNHQETASTVQEIDLLPYGGSLISRAGILASGLPDKKYVVYCDDFEWSARLRKNGLRIFCSPAAVFRVQDRTFRKTSNGGVKEFCRNSNTPLLHYRVRNEVFFRKMLKRTPLEHLSYLLNALIWMLAILVVLPGRRWRTNRKTIFGAIRQGCTGDFSQNPLLN